MSRHASYKKKKLTLTIPYNIPVHTQSRKNIQDK